MNGLRFRQELEKLIVAEVKTAEGDLASGNLPNMREYRYRVGKLHAFATVASLMDIAVTKTEER